MVRIIFAIIVSTSINLLFLRIQTKKIIKKRNQKLNVRIQRVIKKKSDKKRKGKVLNNSNNISFKNLGVAETNLVENYQRKQFGKNVNPFLKNLQSKTFEIYNIINDRLTYPAYYKECEITGIVNTSLNFDSSGRYLAAHSVFKSNSRYLRYHVLKTIQKIFKDRVIDVNDEITIDASFIFDLYSNPHYENEQNITEIFIFYRSANGMLANQVINGGMFNIVGLFKMASRTKRRKNAQKKYKSKLRFISQQNEF